MNRFIRSFVGTICYELLVEEDIIIALLIFYSTKPQHLSQFFLSFFLFKSIHTLQITHSHSWVNWLIVGVPRGELIGEIISAGERRRNWLDHSEKFFQPWDWSHRAQR
ncbi:hypothetical protein L6452_09676 [Arctium lappa]|uniref:Uncharacterized protein n=1 Tax=Arctium lappa TaxID=4217 RepID=A0ACB9DKN5_ARCLA|nr:hypothetical protein L6452_09676 [Arctium lappa]